MDNGVVIALTGSWGSGCTTAAKYLAGIKEEVDGKTKRPYKAIYVSKYLEGLVRTIFFGNTELIRENLGVSFEEKWTSIRGSAWDRHFFPVNWLRDSFTAS